MSLSNKVKMIQKKRKKREKKGGKKVGKKEDFYIIADISYCLMRKYKFHLFNRFFKLANGQTVNPYL